MTSKLNIPEFEEFVNEYKILACAETKLCKLDYVNVKGYSVYCSSGSKVSHKSGGVCVFVEDKFLEELNFINCIEHCKTCEKLCNISNVMWLIMGNILFVIVYIHPEGSRYFDPDIFDSILCTTIELMSHFNVCNICLIGDFNARTGIMEDYVNMSEIICSSNPVLPNMVKDCIDLLNYDDVVLRKSQDTKINNHGKLFIQLCQILDVRITNGRFGHNSSSNTCKDASVVDYMAVTPQLFANIIDMKVKEFNPLLSDVHKSIELHIHPSLFDSNGIESDLKEELDNVKPIEEKCKWTQDKADDFVLSVLNNTQMLELDNDLNQFMSRLLIKHALIIVIKDFVI